MSDTKLEDIVSLCKRRGFIYPGSDVYGGLSGTWDYGPLGVVLKRNIMQLWWRMFVDERDDMLGVDAAILMNQKVWQASGHVDTFTDPLMACEHCKSRYRTDHLIDDQANYLQKLNQHYDQAVETLKNFPANSNQYSEAESQALGGMFGEARVPAVYPENATKDRLDYLLEQRRLAENYLGTFPHIYLMKQSKKCPKCGQVQWSDSRTFNMMFETRIGAMADTIKFSPYPSVSAGEEIELAPYNLKDKDMSNVVYLRPETAQGIFTNFKNVVDSFYPDMPFGLAQQGKAFRNEISPRDFVFRSREFEQMEIEYFVHPDHWQEAFEMWMKLVHEWCGQLGLPADSVHELEVPEADRAHYSKRTVDFEFDFPIGREELLGLAYRTDFDLGNIQRVSSKSMEYRPKDGGAAFVPHVIEPSFGLERAIMAVLSAAYWHDEANERIVLKLPKHLAPVKVAVSPLLKNKPELIDKAREVYTALKKDFGAVMWDDNGNIGKRYRRQDEIGTPYCVVIDFDTLDDNTVTVRDRDTTEQKRVAINQLEQELSRG